MSLVRRLAIVIPVTLAALMSAAQAQSAPVGVVILPGQARSLAEDITDKVIVVLKDQVSGIPATPGNSALREGAVRSVQRHVLSQLARAHARDVKTFSLVNAVAATVSPGAARLLAANPDVATVVPDLPIPVATAPQARTRAAVTRGLKPLPKACAPGVGVQLNPEAIENIHAATQAGKGNSAQALGYTGAGVKVAFIADGIDPSNPDFIRANGKHVIVDYKDFSGTGTNARSGGAEAFLDASSIAAQGRHSYNVSSYGVGLSRPCLIRVLGVAPGASLVALNVSGGSNFVFSSVFLEAIDYAVTVDHVNVLSESFTGNPFPDTASLDLVKMANDAAVKAGVTVTAGTGDSGPTNTIGSPATDPDVISAGATTTYRSYAQTGIGGITFPGVKGWADNNISGLSSGGFTQDGATVDVVAPGDLNWALCTPDPAKYSDCTDFAGKPAPIVLVGGTSESTPLTAGVAALVIQSYARTHHGHAPSPAVVKRIIVSTAQNIGAPGDQQGAGMIDAYQAVLAAASYHGSTEAPGGHAILDSSAQLNAVALPGTTEHLNETLTNDGAGSVAVGLSSRTLLPYQPVATMALSLTKAHDYRKAISFNVAKGQARLNVSVALRGLVRLSVISPEGDLAEYNLPQGIGNYGNAQVASPAPGKWTALVSTQSSARSVAAQFQASTAAWQRLGSLSATSVTLAPGASRTVTLTVSTPPQAGDLAGSLILRSSARTPAFAAVTSVPVTLRSLIPAPAPLSTFTGTLTGGNGAYPDIGQAAYYQVRIPAGFKALNVQVGTGNHRNTFLAELVNPAGVAASAATNRLRVTTAGGDTKFKPQAGAQLHVLDPCAGRWTLIVDFFNTVSGIAVTQPFTVAINDTRVTASALGLPDSATAKLAAGRPVTAGLQVTNNGSTPEAYFVDARLNTQVTAKIATQTTATLKLPSRSSTVPTFLVPSHTTALKATASSSAPLYFDFTWAFGDPDLISSFGKTATGTYSAPEISGGYWSITPFLVGPTGAKPAKSRLAHMSMTATTAAFDPGVRSATGDLWLGSVNTRTRFRPYVVNPGQSVTIPVTITPKGALGSTVTGTIYVADSSFIPGLVTVDLLTGNCPEASDVAAFHYRYTIR